MYIDTNRHGKVFLGAREIRDFFSGFFFCSLEKYVRIQVIVPVSKLK